MLPRLSFHQSSGQVRARFSLCSVNSPLRPRHPGSFRHPGSVQSGAGASVLCGAYNPAKRHFQIAQRRAAGRAYNPAKHHSKIAQRRAGGPPSSVLRFFFPLPVAVSRCRFSLPLLVAVWQGEFPALHNLAASVHRRGAEAGGS